jgi:cardiolipin synthase
VRKEMLDESMGDHAAREINPGEKLKLEDPESCFPRAVRAIEACQPQDPVYLSVFVFQSDEWAQTFARVLIDAAKRGCDVQVIYDEVGSGLSDHKVDADGTVTQLPTNPAIYQKMRDGGVAVVEWPAHSGMSDIISSHLNHRKILIVGGGPNRKAPAVGYAFLNVGTEYAAIWTDFSWEFRGPVLEDMAHMWVEQKNRVISRVKPEKLAAMEGVRAKYKFSEESDMEDWIKNVKQDWKKNKPRKHVYKNIRLVGHIGLEDIDIKTINIAAIKTSVKRVKVQCPYVTDDDFLEAMAAAGRRFRAAGKPVGSVVLLVPDNSDMSMTKLALRTWYEYLIESGVEVRLSTAPMAHGKAKIFDDSVEGGSSNLDTRSLWNNDENIGVVDSKALADEVDKKLFHDENDIIVTKDDVIRYKKNKGQWLKSLGWRKLWLQL